MRSTIALLLTVCLPGLASAGDTISFKRDIAPILLQRCQACHGPQRAAGKFRVDTYLHLMAKSSSGKAIVPGKSADSELYRLLTTTDKDDRMPREADPLSDTQLKLIRQWIDKGAAFDGPDPAAELVSLVPPTVHPEPPKSYRAPVPILSLAFSPDGKELAAGGYHEITLWDPVKGTLLRRVKNVGQRTHGIRYSTDGKLLAVGSGSPGEYGELKMFDAKTGKLIRLFDTSPDILLDIAFSPDNALLASAGADRTIRIYEVADGKEITRIKQHADWVTSLSFSRDGLSLAGSSYDKMVKVFAARTGKLQATYGGHKAKVLAVAFDPKSTMLCTAGEDKQLHVWDPMVVAAQDGTAAQMEERFKKSLPVKHVTGFAKDVLRVAIANGQIFSTAADGMVRQHDLKTLNLVRSYEGHRDWVYALAVDPRGDLLATGSFDGEVRIWNIRDGSLIVRFVAAPGY